MARPVRNPPNPWSSTEVEYLEAPPDAKLEVFEEQARSILSENQSPDVGFRFSVNPYRGCTHACAYCLVGDTPILMADGTTRRLEDLRVGDAICGTERRGQYRRFVKTTVLAHWRTLKPAYRVRLADGTELIASGDHRFLTERGWKHVADADERGVRRPHLTTRNTLLGVGAFAQPPRQDEEYRRGYLCGMIRGDGLLGYWPYQRAGRKNGNQHQFRLALVDLEALTRTQRYLAGFDVGTHASTFAAAVGARRPVQAIRTHARAQVFRIDELIAWPVFASDEWCKGFLAGIFDAEGSYSGGILRICNTDLAIVDRIVECLLRFGFDPVLEQRRFPDADPPRQDMTVVRVRGGLREHLRFMHTVAPAITRKRDIAGQALKSAARLDVRSIEPLGVTLPMFDITTGTEDFIANGVVSHNCYARSSHQYLGFGAGTDFDRKIVVKLNAPALLRKAFLRPSWQGESVSFSGNTDCYQALEASYRLTRGCLEVCLEFRNPVSVITKGLLIRRDVELLAALSREADARVYVSIPFADDALARKIEPWASAPSQRFETVRLLAAAGVPVGVAVAPVIPGLNDSAIPEVLRRASESGARTAFMGLLRLAGEVRPVFEERLEEALPERARKVRLALLDARGGKRNDAVLGERMKGEGARWEAVRALFKTQCARYGINAQDEGAMRSTFRRPPSRQGSLF